MAPWQRQVFYWWAKLEEWRLAGQLEWLSVFPEKLDEPFFPFVVYVIDI